MKVRMIVELSGLYNGKAWPSRGRVADVPDEIGAKLISAGMAAEVAPVETAAKPTADAETATAPKRPRGRPRKTTAGS